MSTVSYATCAFDLVLLHDRDNSTQYIEWCPLRLDEGDRAAVTKVRSVQRSKRCFIVGSLPGEWTYSLNCRYFLTEARRSI